MSRTLIQVRDMTLGYGSKTLCTGISFDICEGDCIMLCGSNGSGKTSLLKKLEQEGEDVMMIPSRIPKIKGFSLREFVKLICYSRSDMGGRISKTDERIIDEALKSLDLIHLQTQDISTLSDGEFQKAAIAAAIIRKASVILLDEPTAFLDAENRIAVLQTLKRLSLEAAHRPAVIFSTHDLHDGLNVAGKVFALGADHCFHSAERRPENEDISQLEKAVSTIFHQK